MIRYNSSVVLSHLLNPLSANVKKWSNTLKLFVGKLPTNCLSVFDHFVGLALKGLIGVAQLRQVHKSKNNRYGTHAQYW